MATVDTKDPKAIIAGVIVCVGLIGGGSMMGLTVEPEEITELRVSYGKLESDVSHLKEQLTKCQATERKSSRAQKGK